MKTVRGSAYFECTIHGCIHLQWSPKALVVKTSLNVTELECWIFFHMSTSIMHLVLTRRKPEHILSIHKQMGRKLRSNTR